MKKKFFAIYALTGALVASPVFTSCVDDTVSPQVEALRDANIKYKNAQTAQMEAQTAINQANAALSQEAQRIANAHAAAVNAHSEAINALTLAEQQYQAAKTEANRVMQEKLDSINFEAEMAGALASLESAKAELETAKTAVEKAQAAEAVAKAQAKYELEIAEMLAETDLMTKKQEFITAQEKMNNVLAGLEEKAQKDARQLNANANAIMLGGYYKSITDGETLNYSSSYNALNSNNSIIALMKEIANENANIIKYEAKLIDVEAYIKEQTAENNDKIEIANALIANYKELQTAGTYDAVKKKYDEAVKNYETYKAKNATSNIEKQEAKEAYDAYIAAEKAKLGTEEANAVYAYIAEQEAEHSWYVDYMNSTEYYDQFGYPIAKVYEFDGASQLDYDISRAESDVENAKADVENRKETYETEKENIATKIETLEPQLAIEKAVVKKYQDALAALKAEADYTALVEAVATAQAAFDADPTPANWTALNNAKAAVDAYTGTGTQSVAQIEEILKKNGGWDTNGNWIVDENYNQIGYEAYVANMEAELAKLKAIDEDAEVELYWLAQNTYVSTTLADLEETLAEKEEALAEKEALKAMFAEDSEAMVAYNAYAEGLVALIEAYNDVETYDNEKTTWESLKNNLAGFVTTDAYSTGSLDYAALIKEQEQAIADAKNAIAKLPMKDENGNDYVDFNNATYDEIIKIAEAKLAAMEAELEARQAEYDAVMKQLDELVKAETETEKAE